MKCRKTQQLLFCSLEEFGDCFFAHARLGELVREVDDDMNCVVLKRAPKELKRQCVSQTAAKVNNFLVMGYIVIAFKTKLWKLESGLAPQHLSCTLGKEEEHSEQRRENYVNCGKRQTVVGD